MKKLAKLVDQVSMEAIHLIGAEKESFTKIGGQPIAKKDFVWPKWNDRSLAFIMQIKLSEIVSLSQMKLFPSKGFIYVFYDKEQTTWGFDPKDKGSWKIIYETESDDIGIIPYPDDLEEDYKYKEKNLEEKRIKTYPSSEDEKFEKLNLTEEQIDEYIDFVDSIYGGNPQHQLFGIENSIQDPDMNLQCQLVSNGLYCGDSSGYNDPEAKKLEKNKADWIFFLQIDSDEDIGMMWGDEGRLYFWIKKDDLSKLNFENIWMILQCG